MDCILAELILFLMITVTAINRRDQRLPSQIRVTIFQLYCRVISDIMSEATAESQTDDGLREFSDIVDE